MKFSIILLSTLSIINIVFPLSTFAQTVSYQNNTPEARIIQKNYFPESPLDKIRTASIDLNGDGKQEILAVNTHSFWCGSAGCASAIYTLRNGTWQEVMSFTGGEILIAEGVTNGWKNINATPYSERFQAIWIFNGEVYDIGFILDSQYGYKIEPLGFEDGIVTRSTPKFDQPMIGKVRKETLQPNESIYVRGIIRGVSGQDWYLCSQSRQADLWFYLPLSSVGISTL